MLVLTHVSQLNSCRHNINALAFNPGALLVLRRLYPFTFKTDDMDVDFSVCGPSIELCMNIEQRNPEHALQELSAPLVLVF